MLFHVFLMPPGVTLELETSPHRTLHKLLTQARPTRGSYVHVGFCVCVVFFNVHEYARLLSLSSIQYSHARLTQISNRENLTVEYCVKIALKMAGTKSTAKTKT